MYNGLLRFNKHILNKVVRVLLLSSGAHLSSGAGSGCFYSNWVRSASGAYVGFFTTVKLD